jgi:hypothetical protein
MISRNRSIWGDPLLEAKMKRANVLVMLSVGLAGVSISACAQEEPVESVMRDIVPGPAVSGYPQGLTCGIAYLVLPTYETVGICEGNYTYQQPALSGWHVATDGDTGLGSGSGFFHQAKNSSDPGIVATGPGENTDQLQLPQGAACGFKERCHDSGETCMGLDATSSCPPGWLPRVGSDINAPNGCGFVWCEYQDPNHLCTLGSSCANSLPQGMACGINDDDRNTGSCLGMTTTPSSTCPNGYYKHGFYDDGRHSGHGVGWCVQGNP